jgi:hypothetical protein
VPCSAFRALSPASRSVAMKNDSRRIQSSMYAYRPRPSREQTSKHPRGDRATLAVARNDPECPGVREGGLCTGAELTHFWGRRWRAHLQTTFAPLHASARTGHGCVRLRYIPGAGHVLRIFAGVQCHTVPYVRGEHTCPSCIR